MYTGWECFRKTGSLSFSIYKTVFLRSRNCHKAGYPIYDSVREPAFKLTNTGEDTFSCILSASFSGSTEAGIDWNVGYNFNDAEEVQPMTSSVAFSNYVNRAFVDPQAEVVSTSNYNIKHNLTGYLAFQQRLLLLRDNDFAVCARKLGLPV